MLGNIDDTDKYINTEIEFKFEVVNPIPKTGYLKVEYFIDEYIVIEQDNVVVRCLADDDEVSTCSCGETGTEDICDISYSTIPIDSDNDRELGVIEIRNLFSQGFKKIGD